jgi:putative SOS response-associated peptidase YedK
VRDALGYDLLTFAAPWERWGEDKLPACTILTADASDGSKDLRTRMPVILPKDGFEPWLSGPDPLPDLGIDAAVEIRPVPPELHSPKYNEPDCVEALTAGAQLFDL